MTASAPDTAPSTSVGSILASVDGTPASYLRAAREIAASGSASALTATPTALLSTFTIDMVVPYFVVEGAQRGLGVTPFIAPFGQLEQQVLDASSALYAGNPSVVVLASRIEDAAPALTDGFVSLAPDDVTRETAAYIARIERLVRAVRERSRAHILVWNQPPLLRLAAGLADPSLSSSQQDAIAEVNRRIAHVCREVAGAVVFDVARLATEVGLNAWYDAKLQHLARVPFGSSAQIAIGQRLARYLGALTRPPRKCLVLDLDNTLWGGVLGEDGVGGIRLGEDYPGNVFKTFQKQLRSYRDRGVLLAIASKNNEADVVELFGSHADMVVRLEDFAARQVHWNDKASSLSAIASELNIGTDALVFFDDNPVEREWVRSRMPQVAVVEVPKDPIRYGAALDASGLFDHLVVTAEDRLRAAQYQQEVGRRALEATSGSVDDFLRALEMRVVLGSVDAATLPRVVQLLGKTNQYNVTTRRHTQAELERMIASGAVALWMRVTDRFGDNGLVGVAIAAEQSAGTWVLDTFLMSCRILGRKAERALLGAVARRVIARGGKTLRGEFIPSKKNAPAAAFFAESGFAAEAEPNRWALDLNSLPDVSFMFEIVDQP